MKVWQEHMGGLLVSTDGAYGSAEWIAKSLANGKRAHDARGHRGYANLTVPAWLAYQKGLIRDRKQ